MDVSHFVFKDGYEMHDFPQGLVYLRRQLIPREGPVPFLKDKEERVAAIPSYITLSKKR